MVRFSSFVHLLTSHTPKVQTLIRPRVLVGFVDSYLILGTLRNGGFKEKLVDTLSEFSDPSKESNDGQTITSFPDKERGVFNEGGLFGERKGWHLPGFDTSSWPVRDISEGLPNGAGVGFFITTFDLNIRAGLDVAMSVTFQEPFGQPYRALLFVNGWMMGKRVGNLGYVCRLGF